MGTETLFYPLLYVLGYVLTVKLNNPLMGTETINQFALLILALNHVKLNNPLMGTETLGI